MKAHPNQPPSSSSAVSNGVVSLSLVRDILQARPNCVVLFIPAEIVTSAL